MRISSLLVAGLIPISSLFGQIPQRGIFWSPELDQPIQQLEEILSQTEQQQPSNYTIANISFLYDAKLLFVFQRFIQALPTEKRQAAVREQNAWLSQRKALMAKEAKDSEGGSIAPYIAGEVKIKATKARIQDLEQKLVSLRLACVN
jgi:uncharacterized protein YecT (DUF1311 family)